MNASIQYGADPALGELLPPLADELERHEARVPMFVTLFIGLFAASAMVIGDHPDYAKITYYLGIVCGLMAGLFYFRLSPSIPVPVLLYASFVIWALMSGVLSEYQELAMMSLRTLVQFFLMVFTFSTLCQDRRSLWIVGAWVALGAIANALWGLLAGERYTSDDQTRIEGLLHSPNSVALMFSVGLCVLWAGVAATRRMWLKVLLFAPILLLLVGIVRTGSRGASVATGLGIVYMLWHFRSRIIHSPAAIIALVLSVVIGIGSVGPWLMSTSLGKRLQASVETAGGDISKREGSTWYRMQLKQWALETAVTHPIFGVGRNCFWQYGRSRGEWDQTTHDNYMSILAETGLPGFLLFFSMYAWIWFKSAKLKKSPLLTGSEPDALFFVRAVLLVLMVADLFDDTTWSNKTVWVLMALGIGWLQGLQRRVAQREEALMQWAPLDSGRAPAGALATTR